MATDSFMGKGIKFPIKANASGGFAGSRNEEKISESMKIILGTAKGERVMRPDFGCDIHKFSFAVINTSTLTLIKSAIEEALVLWEPRIEVREVETSTERLAEGLLMINVAYKVRQTNTGFNLVYPFYINL